MHFLQSAEGQIITLVIDNPGCRVQVVDYFTINAGNYIINCFVKQGVQNQPGNRNWAVLWSILGKAQNEANNSGSETQSINESIHFCLFDYGYNNQFRQSIPIARMQAYIQLMKGNQFPQSQQNTRNHLPKLLRNQSSGSTGKQSSPFAMPEDSEIFRMKEKQKDRKRELKEETDRLKIWEKGVKKGGITIKDLNDLGKKEADEEENQAKLSLIEAAKSAIKNRVKINQPMHEFISKKRQTLLFQMLIDHKREKINEFQQMTRLHRKGLERAEKMLQEDMEAFNSYLNENKRLARDAIKKAERQTREKNEKAAKIKEKLEQQAGLMGRNMQKRQILQILKKYKLFLQSLNPTISQQQRQKIEQQMQKQQQQTQNFNAMNTAEQLEDSEQEGQIFFKHPDQLMDVFHSLEESNLTLMTNLKQMEQQIQQAKNIYHNKKQTMNKKKTELIANIKLVTDQIEHVDKDIEQLRKTTNKDQISTYYTELQSEIIKMAKEMEFVPANQKHLSCLELLKDIELNIERQLDQLKTGKLEKQNLIKQLEKECLARKRERKKQKNEEEMEAEKSLKQKMESSVEREKRKGRPIMARSVVKVEKKKKQDKIIEPEHEVDKRKYLMPD